MVYVTYNLKSFCDAKTFVFLLPCHVHKIKKMKQKPYCPIHICDFFSFQSDFSKVNKYYVKTWFS